MQIECDYRKQYVGRDVLTHSAYEIGWGMVGEKKEQQMTIGIAVSMRNRIIVVVKMDIVNYPYI